MSALPEQLVTVQPGHLRIERPPDYEVVWSRQADELAHIVALCAKENVRKVLIVGSATRVRLSTTDLFQLGEAIARAGLRVAMVENHDATSDDTTFLEHVTSNRGQTIGFFEDEADAREWLGI